MTTDPPPCLDVNAYLARTGYHGECGPTRAVLEELHLTHVTSIPFENLDILLGRPIRLDLESLQAKLVRGKRGGYCFEQNMLFAAVLEQLGFRVTRLAARVRYGTTRLLPRTHMLLRVEAEGASWLADVGFGGEGLLMPVPLAAGPAVEQYAWTYRLREDGGQWVLQSLLEGDWRDLYAFTLEPQFPVDFEVANYYVSTHPDSRFTQTLTVQRSTPEGRYILRDREFTVVRDEVVNSHPVKDEEELLSLLAGTFGLEFPSETRFRVPAWA
jgi:N-hydroxyarylamine O-acetyltransferase